MRILLYLALILLMLGAPLAWHLSRLPCECCDACECSDPCPCKTTFKLCCRSCTCVTR